MTDAVTSLDLVVLVGALPEIACEEPHHESSPLHSGPATHYVRVVHGCCMPAGTIVAVCRSVPQIIERDEALITAGKSS